MARVTNNGGIVNRGGNVRISGQAIGNQSGGDKDTPEPKGGKTNTGIVNRGGQVTVRRSWVNGEWVE